jgi:putative DNA primase/helicase
MTTTTTTTTMGAFVPNKAIKLIVNRAAPTLDDPPPFSDDYLALELAVKHAADLRYVAEFNRWFHWTGTTWETEKTHKPFDHARKVCRAQASECDDEKQRRHIASAKTVNAVVTLARTDRRLVAVSEQWDTDPWLLNTPAGVVDLRTGAMRLHNASDYMTKITGVAPDAARPIPRWMKFLDRVMAGDADMIAFLQRVAGYCLTGITAEHAMFFLHGTGANGKSTFINTISRAFNDYHRTAAIETFTASKRRVIPLIWLACTPRVWSPPSRPRTAMAGPRARSRRSRAATKFQHASCARIFSSSRRSSSC